jgi:hypothetical protein
MRSAWGVPLCCSELCCNSGAEKRRSFSILDFPVSPPLAPRQLPCVADIRRHR